MNREFSFINYSSSSPRGFSYQIEGAVDDITDTFLHQSKKAHIRSNNFNDHMNLKNDQGETGGGNISGEKPLYDY